MSAGSSPAFRAGSPHSPYLVVAASATSPRSSPRSSPAAAGRQQDVASAAILDRLARAVTLDDRAESRRKVAALLSKYAVALDDPGGAGGSGFTPLMHAAIAGNAECCQELLAAGASGDARAADEFNGWSALHFCSAMGQDRCCSTLVKSNAVPVDQRDNEGFTPLSIAAMRGHNSVIDALARAGHSIDAPSFKGATPLLLAAQEGRLFTLKRLLHLGANIKSHDMSGASALTVSARAGHTNIAKALLDAGADVNHRTFRKVSILNIAVDHGRHNFCRTLLQHGALVDPKDVKTAADSGFFPVLVELLPHVDVIPDGKAGRRLLMKQKLHHGQKMSMSLTPALHAAAKRGNTSALALLIDYGASADAHVGISDGYPPLHRAIKHAAGVDTVDALLKAGADAAAAAKNRQGYTPILLASLHGRLDICKLLLDHNPKLLTQVGGGDGNSVMHLAAWNGDVDICRLLLLRLNRKLAGMKNKTGATALLLSCMHGHLPVVQTLLEDKWARKTINMTEASKCSPLMMACKHAHVDVVRVLIANGANIALADGIGATPLHAACDVGHEDIVAALLEARANPVTAKLNGSTPLHVAGRHGHVDVVRLLLRLGLPRPRKKVSPSQLHAERRAVVNAPMRRCGSSPLFLAIKQDHDEVSDVLARSRFTDLEMRNADGDTVLMMAVLRGNTGIVEVLVRLGADPYSDCAMGRTPMSELKRRPDGPLSREMLTALLRPADLMRTQEEEEGVGDEVAGIISVGGERARRVGGELNRPENNNDVETGGERHQNTMIDFALPKSCSVQ
jgi:ankyrin repeat protein